MEMMKSFIDKIGNNLKPKDDVGKWYNQMVLNEKASDFDLIPRPITEEGLWHWYNSITD